MEYYLTIKRNEIELFVMRWMESESVIQSEVSQKEKNKYSMLTHMYTIQGEKKKSVLEKQRKCICLSEREVDPEVGSKMQVYLLRLFLSRRDVYI